MTTKHTLYSLCQEYDKVEIPIIQRDYAQGRKEQNDLKNKFVDYLLSSLKSNTAIELDFIYGQERTDIAKDGKTSVMTFIPVDGQQRLTTLWLLHWFLAVREGRLNELRNTLSKFTYETRPTAHDFCHHLVTEDFPSAKMDTIVEFVRDSVWFDPEWESDSSVNGMLRMLETFSSSFRMIGNDIFLDQLLAPNNIISFYFISLEDFGLSEELYIRMNARGKILTTFENFKSEFYKILKDYSKLDVVKDKMEYEWVNNLWCYRKDKCFTIDDLFMNFLRFITRMLYFSQVQYRSEAGYETDFTNFNLLGKVYSNNDNVDFLIFALDYIPFVNSLKHGPVLWDGRGEKQSISDVLSICIKGEALNVDQLFVLYAAFIYVRNHKSKLQNAEGIADAQFCERTCDFVRVVRNLIVNTNDKSEREHPRIIRSIKDLSLDDEIYSVTNNPEFNLKGFSDLQCAEEHVKSCIIGKHPSAKTLIHRIEDNYRFKGNIKNILAAVFQKAETEISRFEFQGQHIDNFEEKTLQKIYDAYKRLAEDDFNEVWGDMINTSFYTHDKSAARIVFDRRNYSKNPAIISLTARFTFSKFDTIKDFLVNEEKRFVRRIVLEHDELSQVRDVKIQLQLLYILCVRVMERNPSEFFANGYNFGWLKKENGFTSLFTQGIDGDPWFSEENPIFQTYNSLFRYNMGLYKEHAIPCEIVGKGGPQKAWEKLIEWANS